MTARFSALAISALLLAGATMFGGCANEHEKTATTNPSSTWLPGKAVVTSAQSEPASTVTVAQDGDYGLFRDDASPNYDPAPVARFPLKAGESIGFTDTPKDTKAKPGRYAVAGNYEFPIDVTHGYQWIKLPESYRNFLPIP